MSKKTIIPLALGLFAWLTIGKLWIAIVIAAFAFALFLKNSESKISQGQSDNEFTQEDEEVFKHTLLILMAEMMKADGKLRPRELDSVKATICRYYKKEEEQKAKLKEFQSILNTQYDIKFVCLEVNDRLDDVAVEELFMEILAVAYADDDFSDKEKPVIKAIRSHLGITTQEYQRIYSLFMKKRQDGYYRTKKKAKTKFNYSHNYSQGYNESHNENNRANNNSSKQRVITIEEQEAYDILGVDHSVADDEVKKAYRALAVMYHPDRVANLGDEAIRQATESMKEINSAWELIKEARGIK